MNAKELRRKLKKAWCAETAYGEWTPECPSLNQCCVTALVVQEIFGGTILWAYMEDGDKHYWNRTEEGLALDFTKEQFDYLGMPQPTRSNGPRSRKSLLKHKSVKKRYELLCDRLGLR